MRPFDSLVDSVVNESLSMVRTGGGYAPESGAQSGFQTDLGVRLGCAGAGDARITRSAAVFGVSWWCHDLSVVFQCVD